MESEDAASRVEKMFSVAVSAAEKVAWKIRSITAEDYEYLMYKVAILFFFCKAYKSYQAFRCLWKAGFEQDAVVLARSVFEILLQVRYMEGAPKERARLFTEHGDVLLFHSYRMLKGAGVTEMTGNIEQDEDRLQELRTAYKTLKGKYPRVKNWWGSSIEWLASKAGNEMKKRYYTIYWEECNISHSNILAAAEYLKETRHGFFANCYASQPKDGAKAMNFTLYFFDILGAVERAFNLGLDKDLKEKVNRCAEIMGWNKK